MPTNTNWSTWSRIKLEGESDGMIRWKQRPGSYIYQQDPFHRTTIPCNPDQVGSTTVTETRNFHAQGSIDISSTFGGTLGVSSPVVNTVTHSLSARVGVTIGASHSVQVSETVYGEKCRSVQYEYFADYNVFDIEIIPPDAPQIGLTAFSVWEPVGWYKVKTYVPPTCCTRRTSEIGMRLDSKKEELSGEARYAIGNATDNMIVARGRLASSNQFLKSLESISLSIESMTKAEILGVTIKEEMDELFDIAEELVASLLKDLHDASLLNIRNPMIANEVLKTTSLAYTELARARDLRYADPATSMKHYFAAYQFGEAAKIINHNSIGDMTKILEPPLGVPEPTIDS